MGNTTAEREREVLATYVAEDVDVGGVGGEHEGSRRERCRSLCSALRDCGAYQTVRQVVQQALQESFVDVGAPMGPSSPWWREPLASPTLAVQVDYCNRPLAGRSSNRLR